MSEHEPTMRCGICGGPHDTAKHIDNQSITTESGGGGSQAPEQAGEEPMEDKEKSLKKPELYGRTEETEWRPTWESLKQKWQIASKDELRDQAMRLGLAINLINEGRKLGVPIEAIDQFAKEVISQGTKHQNYNFVHSIRDHVSATNDTELRALAQKAYQHDLETGNTGDAANLAELLYGKESKAYQRVRAVEESELGEELLVTLSKDATFVDLSSALRGSGIDDDSTFYEELGTKFTPEIVDEFFDIQSDQTKAVSIRVVDFFKKHGYDTRHVEEVLPIKFKTESKKGASRKRKQKE